MPPRFFAVFPTKTVSIQSAHENQLRDAKEDRAEERYFETE